MRRFNFNILKDKKWDNEIVNYLSLIHEAKGKQSLYLKQKPDELNRLVEIAKIQSTESSNSIEGIRTTETRLRQLMSEKTTPRNRDEKEIAGYRDVLNTVHENYEYIPVTGNIILQLHRDLMQYANTGNGGQYKITQNYLKETKEDGAEAIRFTPRSTQRNRAVH